jgi:cytosine/adenosine deaminase-related metal-dependent hydrolase
LVRNAQELRCTGRLELNLHFLLLLHDAREHIFILFRPQGFFLDGRRSARRHEEEEMMRSGSGPMWENRVRAGMRTPPVTGTSSLLYFLDRLEKVHPAPFDEHILLVHEVCMDAEGIAAVKAKLHHPFIALCPLSNIYIHDALPPVELLRNSGLSLTVGTDSLSSNDDLDMVSELFCLQENFPQLSLEEMLGWACSNGAAFLGKEDVMGRLEAGMRPGIVCIDNLADGARLTTASTSYRIR